MASIALSGAGTPLSIAIGTTVTVTAAPLGAASYLWEFLDIPDGSAAAFVDPTLSSTTFVVDTEGSYLIRLTVDGVATVQSIAGAPITTPEGPIRIPAAGETFEGDPSKGWARPVQAALRLAALAYNAVMGLGAVQPWKLACRTSDNVDVPLTGAAPLTIDGIVMADGERTLLRGQTAPEENGIYEVDTDGVTYTLTRPDDANTPTGLLAATTMIREGTWADLAYQQSVDGTIVVDTTPLYWTLLAQAANIVTVPIGTTAALVDLGATKVLRWTIAGTDYEVELTAEP